MLRRGPDNVQLPENLSALRGGRHKVSILLLKDDSDRLESTVSNVLLVVYPTGGLMHL
jgi:hypothetical protein